VEIPEARDPAIAALAGCILLILRDRRLALVLAPVPLLFVLYIGTQGRYLARWFLPAYPILVVLAGYALVQLALLAWGRRVWTTAVGVWSSPPPLARGSPARCTRT
jgi:hypothetical protein